MKTIIVILLLLLTTICTKSQNSMIFSAALNSGVCAHGSKQIDPLIGIDIEARHNKFGLYVSATGDFSFDTSGSRIYEFIIGPRWYIGNLKKINGVIETGFGDYIHSDNNATGRNRFGFNFGLGLNYPVSKEIDISLKGKYHLYSGGYGTTKGDVYFSFRYFFNK